VRLDQPDILRAFLKRHGLRPDKGLGQHFLVSAATVDAIVAAASHCKGILEIGPGPGVLTGPLSESAERVAAIELDPTMPLLLSESAPKAIVVKEDALKADLGALLADLPPPRAVVSNLPYYITGPLLGRIADVRASLDVAVLMMQKEVADRILAKPGKRERGALSVALQSQFEISRVAHVPAGAFLPPPKVDSSVLRLVPREGALSEAALRIVRMGFAQPRKTLANNLVAGFQISRDEAVERIEAVGLSETVRPAELTEVQWAALALSMTE
jgi:16S rRNA (adenine1518-N6/adenine1519-N6)-dimethyltransferase